MFRRIYLLLLAMLLTGTVVAAGAVFAQEEEDTSGPGPEAQKKPSGPVTRFDMVRSSAAEANGCLEGASAKVTVRTVRGNQVMDVALKGVAPNTGFTLFVIQQPDSPFGLSWYQGDIDTNSDGRGKVKVKGIFNDETHAFALAPPVPATQVDPGVDATENPVFAPVHTAHLGVWFADPAEAEAAGCSDAVTPFDGDHEAGIQALSTKNFGPLEGPLLGVR